MPPPKPLRLLMNYFCLFVILSAAALGSPTTPAANNQPASASISVDDVNGPNCLGDSLTNLARFIGSYLNFKRQPSRLEQTQQFDEQPVSHLEQLPADVLIEIASKLPTLDLKNFESTCKTVRALDLALERELAELNVFQYYNKAYDWLEDTWVDLLCKDKDVNRFDVRLVVQEYVYYIHKFDYRYYVPRPMVREELRHVMKATNDEEVIVWSDLVNDFAEQVWNLHFNREKPMPEPLFFLDTDYLSPKEMRGYYSDDRQMDGQIALILSQCGHFTANKAYDYIQKESQNPAYRQDNGPEFANLVAYLKDVHKARREIWKEKLAASDLMGFDDDSRMSVVLEKLLPDAGRPTIKDAIQQARRTLGLEIAVQNRKYGAVRYYVKLGGAIHESSLKRIFRSVNKANRQVLPILLQHWAVSVDMFSWLLLDVLERRQDPSIVKLYLEDPRAVRPAIDKAYEHAFTTSDVRDAIASENAQRRDKSILDSLRLPLGFRAYDKVEKARQFRHEEVERRVKEIQLAFQENDKRRAE